MCIGNILGMAQSISGGFGQQQANQSKITAQLSGQISQQSGGQSQSASIGFQSSLKNVLANSLNNLKKLETKAEHNSGQKQSPVESAPPRNEGHRHSSSDILKNARNNFSKLQAGDEQNDAKKHGPLDNLRDDLKCLKSNRDDKIDKLIDNLSKLLDELSDNKKCGCDKDSESKGSRKSTMDNIKDSLDKIEAMFMIQYKLMIFA